MNTESKVAKPYAQSLLSYAIERKELEAVATDMELIANTCRDSKDLRLLLKSPIVKIDKKISIINKIFGGQIGTISLNFIGIIARRNREKLIPEIAEAFIALYKKHLGVLSATVISAIPLSSSERAKVKEMVGKLGQTVELTEKVDKDIIGGIIIRVGDKQYDGSVSSRIASIKREFTQKFS